LAIPSGLHDGLLVGPFDSLLASAACWADLSCLGVFECRVSDTEKDEDFVDVLSGWNHGRLETESQDVD
jgi:hypothetical protein